MISFSTEGINGPFRSGIGMLVLCRGTFFESESIVLSKLFADSRVSFMRCGRFRNQFSISAAHLKTYLTQRLKRLLIISLDFHERMSYV